MNARGIIGGYEDGTARPNNPVTQFEAITMVVAYNLYDLPSVPSIPTFTPLTVVTFPFMTLSDVPFILSSAFSDLMADMSVRISMDKDDQTANQIIIDETSDGQKGAIGSCI